MKVNNRRKIAEGAALLGISAIIVKIIGVIYKVPLSYILGDDGMGYFNSAYAVYTLFFMLSTAGVPKAITIIVSKNEAEFENKSYSIAKTLSLFFLFVGLIICFLFYIFASPISKFISNVGALHTMYAIAPSIPFLCLGGVLRGYLIGKTSFLAVAFSELISGLSKLVFGLVFAVYSSSRNLPLEEISAYTMLGITIGSILCLIPLVISVHNKRGGTGSINKIKTVKEALKITLPITISSLLSGLAGVIDLTLIMRGLVSSGYSNEVANVIYGNYTTLAIPMFTLATTLISQIATSLLPAIARENSNENKGNGTSFAMFLAFFIAFPIAIFYFLFPKDVLGILFEEGSVALGAIYLSSIAPSILLIAPLTVINTTLEAEGKVTLPVISLTLGSCVKLIISALCISNVKIGIFGASLGTYFSYLVPLFISASYMKRKITYKIRFAECFFIPAFSSIMSVICGLFIRPVLQNIESYRLKSLSFLISIVVIYLFLSAILSKKLHNTTFKYGKVNKISS